jgi:hypothetical protein
MPNPYKIAGAPVSGPNAPANNLARFNKWIGRGNPIFQSIERPTYQQKKEVLMRDKGRCQLCGFSGKTEVHHNIRRRIGDNRPGNLHTYCEPHHDGFIHGKRSTWPWPR